MNANECLGDRCQLFVDLGIDDVSGTKKGVCSIPMVAAQLGELLRQTTELKETHNAVVTQLARLRDEADQRESRTVARIEKENAGRMAMAEEMAKRVGETYLSSVFGGDAEASPEPVSEEVEKLCVRCGGMSAESKMQRCPPTATHRGWNDYELICPPCVHHYKTAPEEQLPVAHHPV